ncbi:hypothetical protein Leryth_002058 [Lithospermum erythrorhizon]|nr:hypothetical protein Leryth_002058 [Lithospermum erythrorhizon]
MVVNDVCIFCWGSVPTDCGLFLQCSMPDHAACFYRHNLEEDRRSFSRNGPGSLMQMQEEELRVKVEPVRWWDVCRRADWPDREEHINGITVADIDGTSSSTTKFSGVTKVASEGQGHEDMPQAEGFGHYFQEDYCEDSTNSESQDLAAGLAVWHDHRQNI